MNKQIARLFAVMVYLAALSAQAASEWRTQEYDLYPGDFNGDSRTDMLYVSKSPDKGSGIALSDGTQLVAGAQVWNANGFGIAWHSNIYLPVIGDFNWDGRSDIFMHRQTPGSHYLLIANPDGTFTGLSQTLPNSQPGTANIIWSGDQHRIISVKAKTATTPTKRGHRLFLQAVRRGDPNAIFDTSPTGWITGAMFSTQPWTDGYLGFQWNLQQAIVHSGDFSNDGQGDLLIQAKPDIVLIDYDVPIPVPRYRPGSFGIVYQPVGSAGSLFWDRKRGGIDWSASNSNLVIGDFDADGWDDIIVQPKRSSGGAVQVVRVNSTTNPAFLDTPGALTFSGLSSATGDAVRLHAANINGTPSERAFGLYLQATAPGGTDLIAHTVPVAGGAVSTVAQSQVYQSSPTPGTAVGLLPGTFSVDPSGAANYEIPIAVPPGINGLHPELALSYTSRGGNGLMGVGWTVKGLSAISRCPTTYEVDGITDGVDLDNRDSYCLDGMRLKVVTGTEGGLNAEYRTEIESVQRITSAGGAAGDPGSWTVRDKASLIRSYGTLADARIELQGKSQAHVWAIKKIEDRYSNFISYSYSENNALSTFEPTDISWGRSGNIVGRVHFNYWTTRSDPTSGYLAGSAVGTTKLLKSIDVFSRVSATVAATDATWLVRTYFLNYDTSPNTTLTHLREVVMCDGGSGAAQRCLGSTKFRWQDGTPGFGGQQSTTMADNPDLRPLDISGDGRTDYIWSSNSRNNWNYTLSSLFGTQQGPGISTRGEPWNAMVIDYNTDGFQDLIQRNGSNLEWIEGGPNGLVGAHATTIPADAITHASTSAAVGDFDGDGTQDLAYARRAFPSSDLKIHLNASGGFAAPSSSNLKTISLNGVPLVATGLGPWQQPHNGDQQAVVVINFDGDGRDDLLVRVGTGCSEFPVFPGFLKYSCSGQRYNVYSFDPLTGALALIWSQIVDASNPEWGRLKVLDANSDGLSDILYATPSGWTLRVGTGSAATSLASAWSASSFTGTFRVLDPETHRYFNEQQTINLTDGMLRYAQVVDFDRDTRSDIMFDPGAGTTWRVLRNSGTGFMTEGMDTGTPVVSADRAMLVDDRGDGLPDLVSVSGGNYFVRYGRGPAAAGVIDRVTDGMGSVTQVQYAPLTEQDSGGTNVLYKGHTAMFEGNEQTSAVAFPYANVLMPMIVVAQIAQDNGLGAVGSSVSSAQTAYSYEGLKQHRRGRGILGFARIAAQNVNAKILTINEYAQRWPYVGMVTKSEQRYPDIVTVTPLSTDLGMSFGSSCETSYFCSGVHPTIPITITMTGPPIKTTVNTLSNLYWSASGRWFPYTLKSVETVYPLQVTGLTSDTLKRTTTEFLDQSGGTAGNRYDDYGNPYYVRVTVDDGSGGDAHVTSTANTYLNDATSNWCVGRISDTVVTHSKTLGIAGNPAPQSIVRHSTFSYPGPPSCDFITETIEPGTSYEQWTSYTYDAYGNRSGTTTGGAGIPVAKRRSTSGYFVTTQGQFAATMANAAGFTDVIQWDPRFGTKTQVSSVTGQVSTVTTDSFGRITSELPIQGLGVYKNTNMYWCAYAGCYDSRSVTVVTGTTSDGGQVRTEFDRLNRETRTGKLTLDGRWLWTEKHYDQLGREYLASQPYFDSAKRCWTFRRFDLNGRVTYQRDPYKTGANSDGECGASVPAYDATDAQLPGGLGGGRSTQTEYDIVDGALVGTRITANANDATAKRVSLKWVNVFGRTRTVQDETSSAACTASSTNSASCIATFYDHDAQGNLSFVRRSGQLAAGGTTSAATIDTVASFNVRGFKTGMTDPDMGSWLYDYNAFGELTSQTDAKGQLTLMDYDKLGRMISRTEGAEGTTNWYYDDTSIGGFTAFGKLTRVVAPSGYEERHVYDNRGRLASLKRLIDGNWHRVDQTYDAQSRLDLLKYPSWNTSTDPDAVPADSARMVVRHNYNQYGFLESTQNAATGTIYWKIDTIDHYGVTQETLGNGVVTKRIFEATTGYLRSITAGIGTATTVQNMAFTFDRNGNALSRADTNISRSEDFTYDAIDRLGQTRLFNNATLSGAPASTETMLYDVFGNIRTKGLGYSSYNHVVDTSGASLCNTPLNPTSQPHAVRQVVAGGTTRTMCYDANGNLTRQLSGQYDTVTWWVANLAKRITKGSDYAEFTYGPDRARYKQVAVRAGVTETTTYVGGLYERYAKSGTTEHTYFIKGGGSVAVVAKCAGACATVTTRYVHRDHLQSVVALSDELGVVGATDRMTFDAWGKRRLNTWAATTPGAQIPASNYTSFTRRGFTGHEQLDFLGVVHMNGRVYDSEAGRFLSADPFVQYPESTQGFNRYSYVDNNPLTHTDPSGFLSFRQAFGILVQVVLTAIAPQFAPVWAAVAGAISGGVRGAVVGLVTAGFGLGAAGIGNAFVQAIVQGAVGGMLSMAMGGRFADGFIGGFAGALAGAAIRGSPLGSLQGASGIVLRVVVRAVVGGTISELCGGSFASGALSAAFTAALEEGVARIRMTDHSDADRGYFAREKSDVLLRMSRAIDDIRGRPFSSMDLAAKALSERLLPLSEEYNIEIGALIFPGNAPDAYYVGTPQTQFNPAEVNSSGSISTGPGGFGWDARWHTHPSGPGPGDFSDRDILNVISLAGAGAKATFVSYTNPMNQPTLLKYDVVKASSAAAPYRDRARYACTVTGMSGAYAGC